MREYIHSLLALWKPWVGDIKDGSFSATVEKLKNLSEASECICVFPLSNPQKTFEESSRPVRQIIDRATGSVAYQRLKASHEANDESLDISQKLHLDPTNALLNADIDKLFVYSCLALQSFNDEMLSRDLESVGTIVRRSRTQCETMWKSA